MSGRSTSYSAEPVVSLLEKRGRLLTASPFFERGRRINVDRDSRARVGDLALVLPKGKLVRRIGRPDVARDVIEALMLDRGLRRRFAPDVERAAREASAKGPGHLAGRRDLTELPTFTIDPPTARDFDDAISAERIDGGGVRIWVHIADVSAYVRPGSPVDREAHRRATSVYVPGAVEPMLPEALSNDVCSLKPDVERLAVTAELDFAGDRVTRSSFYRSTIRSDRRYSYPEVDALFASGRLAPELAAAREVAAALEAKRAGRGALIVVSSEPSFSFDADGHVESVQPDEQTESHRLIEHLMIAANEAVAGLLEDRKLPALYRVHERPDGARVARLADQLASLDVAVPALSDVLSPQQALDAVGEISRAVAPLGKAGLSSLVLRALKQAVYSPENVGHAGLRSSRYCHFTSPIRRYPDLVVHRALLAAIGAGESMPDRSRLDELGTWCSQRERDAMSIERKADDVARAFLLERVLFKRGWQTEFSGEIVGIIGAGAFIAFGDGFEGMLPVRRLRGDWWELNEFETALVGTRSERGIRIGDPATVQVVKVGTARGRVDLAPVEL